MTLPIPPLGVLYWMGIPVLSGLKSRPNYYTRVYIAAMYKGSHTIKNIV